MITCVCSLMGYKLASLCELPAARCTWEWFLASMNTHVLHQVRAADESLVTQSTHERPLPSVCLQMFRQMSRLLVALVTLQSINQSINQTLTHSCSQSIICSINHWNSQKLPVNILSEVPHNVIQVWIDHNMITAYYSKHRQMQDLLVTARNCWRWEHH